MDVAVAGVAEARNQQPMLAPHARDEIEERGTRPRGTTRSWLILRGASARSANESSRRASQMASRSASFAARRTSSAPAALAGAEDALGFFVDAGRHAVHFDDQHRAGSLRRERSRPRCRSTARSDSPSMSSIVAGTTRSASSAETARTASPMLANVACSVACTAGFGTRRSVISVMIASVPSDPTSSCVRS